MKHLLPIGLVPVEARIPLFNRLVRDPAFHRDKPDGEHRLWAVLVDVILISTGTSPAGNH